MVIQLTGNGQKERGIKLTFIVIFLEAHLVVLSGHSELGSKLESVSV
jgi:hypothetical protein